MSNKSTLQWLQTIEDPEIREKAINYYNQDERNKNCPYPPYNNNLFGAILWAFDFKKTNEGVGYWIKVANSLDERFKKVKGGKI